MDTYNGSLTKNKIGITIIAIILASLSCLSNSSDSSERSQQPSQLPPSNTQPPTAVFEDSSQPTVTIDTRAATTETAIQIETQLFPRTPKLPESSAVDLILKLEELGFRCFNAKLWRPDNLFSYDTYHRECLKDTDYEYTDIDMRGYDLETIDYITASVSESSQTYDSIAIPFLSDLATIPYTGATPIEAQNWVKDTIPTITEYLDERFAEFGGVSFYLSGVPGFRLLIIGSAE